MHEHTAPLIGVLTQSLEKIIELGNSIMQNEEHRQHADRLKTRHSVTPPSKLSQRVARDRDRDRDREHAGHLGGQDSTPQSTAILEARSRHRSGRSPEKPAWTTLSSRHQSPPMPARASNEQNGQSKASRGSRDSGAMVSPTCPLLCAYLHNECYHYLQLLGAGTPSSRGSPADSNQSWGASQEGAEQDVNSSLLGNDTVRRATTKKRIPGMEPKGKRRQQNKVSTCAYIVAMLSNN
jgi:hypothetical protein